MTRVRLGAVGYLNARPLVYALDRSPRFDLRFDIPSTCAALLHGGGIDVGLIPSIEYLRGGPYFIVPDLAIASRGPVASVTVFTSRPMEEVRSMAMDTSSRTSVALARVLCARRFKVDPVFESLGPDLPAMLARCDAALVIGDHALIQSAQLRDRHPAPSIEAIDLGEAWTRMTGLPFVYAFWAGRRGALDVEDVAALHRARDAGVGRPDEIARDYFAGSPEFNEAGGIGGEDLQAIGARYLRDNIKYHLGDEERAGLELFYCYAAEIRLAPAVDSLRFYRGASHKQT
jgi:chorismate dehydratase